MSDAHSIDNVSESKHYKRFIGFLRLTGGIVGILSVVLGVIGLAVLGGLNPRNVINDLYQIIFGLLILLIELRLKQLLVHFKFLTHFAGVGVFYVFLGGLSLGSKWYQYVVGIVEIALGAVYVILALLNRKMYDTALPSQKLSKPTVEASSKEPKKLPASAFEADPISDIEAQPVKTKTADKYRSTSATPGGPTPGNDMAGNAASDNPFDEFDQSSAKRTRGGYAM